MRQFVSAVLLVTMGAIIGCGGKEGPAEIPTAPVPFDKKDLMKPGNLSGGKQTSGGLMPLEK